MFIRIVWIGFVRDPANYRLQNNAASVPIIVCPQRCLDNHSTVLNASTGNFEKQARVAWLTATD